MQAPPSSPDPLEMVFFKHACINTCMCSMFCCRYLDVNAVHEALEPPQKKARSATTCKLLESKRAKQVPMLSPTLTHT